MKIFALTTFVLCLICVLSLQVESFEEGKPKAKKGKKTVVKKPTPYFGKSCIKISYDTKTMVLSASCKKNKKVVKSTLLLTKCGKLNKGKVIKKTKCSINKSSKNNLECKGKTVKKLDLNKFIKITKAGKLKC